jgi:selenium metabolism protein YedF
MAEKIVDARGQACPRPVLMTREALGEGGGAVRVLVDNEASAENVRRMAASMGCSVEVARDGADFRVVARPGDAAANAGDGPVPEMVSCERPGAAAEPAGRPVVLIDSDVFGRGDDELGRVLMRGFVKTLKEVRPAPARLIFANAGVRLTTGDSELVDDLRELERLGAEVLSCGTCLDYFGLGDALRVGRVSNMFEIADALLHASSVVKP